MAIIPLRYHQDNTSPLIQLSQRSHPSIEHTNPFSFPAWDHPLSTHADKFSIELASRTMKEVRAVEIKAQLHNFSNSISSLLIFTDGSRLDNGACSLTFVFILQNH